MNLNKKILKLKTMTKKKNTKVIRISDIKLILFDFLSFNIFLINILYIFPLNFLN